MHKHWRKKRRRVSLIFTTTVNNIYQIKIQSLKMNLLIKTFVDAVLGLVDHDTNAPITATFANTTYASDNPAVFTCNTDVNADGTLDVVGVAAGNANLHVETDATYTDGNTNQSVTVHLSKDIPMTVTAPAGENVDLTVNFTAAQPTP
jgi:hypothetical protein